MFDTSGILPDTSILWGMGYCTVSMQRRTVGRLYSRLGVQTILKASQYLDQSYKCSEAERDSAIL